MGSDGRLGLMLHPRQRRIAEVAALVRHTLPAGPGRSLQAALLRGIPAERHAVRLRAGGSLNLFFKIDLSSSAVERLSAGLGLDTAGSAAAAFFASGGEPACGIASEVSPGGAVRLRFYAMVSGAAAFRELAARARDRLAIDLSDLTLLLRPFLYSGAPLVVNLGCAEGGSLSFKLELPDVPLELAAEVIRTPEERRVWRTCLALARALDCTSLSYLGLRPHGDIRQLSFYLSADALCRAGAVASA